MKHLPLLLVAALLLPGCSDESASHADIFNRGTVPVELYVVFSSSDGDVVREETRTLGFGESFKFSLDHPGDGAYRLTVEAEDGRSAGMTLTWPPGPGRARFYVYDDRIEERQVVT